MKQTSFNRAHLDDFSEPLNSDRLSKIFHSAIVSRHVKRNADFSAELTSLTQRPAFQFILNTIQQLASSQRISEQEAAEQLVETFQNIDKVLKDYLCWEGIDRINSSL